MTRTEWDTGKGFSLAQWRAASVSPEDIRRDLLAFGVVLLRDMVSSPAEFEALSQAFCQDFYNSGARRSRHPQGDGYTTEVYRENFTLLGHSEGTYLPHHPSLPRFRETPGAPEVCFFWCLEAPSEAGGETTVIDGVRMRAKLPPDLRERLESQGVIYAMSWDRERWQYEFQVTDAATLAALLAPLPGIECQFHGDQLELRFATAAITPTLDGRRAFVPPLLGHLPRITHPRYQAQNPYAKATNQVFFGDGEPLSDELANLLIDLHDEGTHPHRWQAGDVLILDNTRFLHGRRMTTKPCPRVIASRFGRLKSGSLVV